MKKLAWIYFGIGLVALVLVIAVLLPRLQPYSFYGTLIQSPDPAFDFTLTAHTGQRTKLSDFQGKLVVLYFGYTFCPDVCPTTLSEINKAMEILGDKADEVQVIMISVDSERDSPEKMAEYVAHFNPDFLGLTGIPEKIAETAALYGIFYQKHEETGATGYLIDHTASVMVIDKKGHLKLVFPFGTPAKHIADDLAYLLR